MSRNLSKLSRPFPEPLYADLSGCGNLASSIDARSNSAYSEERTNCSGSDGLAICVISALRGDRASPGSARMDHMTATPAASPKTAELRLAHSPDSDDAFMFYALATGKVRLPGVKFTHILSDIESLNQAAHKETYDITAISFYGYAFVADKYVLLDCGASFGEGYGPIVVSSHPDQEKRSRRAQNRDSRHADHFLSRAEALRAERRDRDDALRQDSGRGAGQGSRSGPADSRRAAAVLADRIAPRGGSRASGGRKRRTAAASGRECHSPAAWDRNSASRWPA